MWGGKTVVGKMKVRKMGEKGKPESEKYSRCAQREVRREIKGEIS